MRIFVAPNNAVLSPFETPARDAWLLDRPLGEHMTRELVASGLTVERVASLEEAEDRAQREPRGAFVMHDSVACSRAVLRRFVRAARGREAGAFLCALPRGVAIDIFGHIDGLAPREAPGSGSHVWTVPLGFIRGSARLRDAAPLVLRYKENVSRTRLPPVVPGKTEEQFAVSDSYMCNISHWVHVLRTNTAAIPAWWFNRLRSGAYVGTAWGLWRALLGFPWIRGRVHDAIRSVSWRASLHHTARVGLSVVQRGATIGAFANVDSSFIGAGASIGDGAQIFGSVIGPGAFVARNAVVFGSVLYPEALAGQTLMQLSVLGARACAFTNSAFYDLNFSRNIRVSNRGAIVDSGSQFLGACVGPDARVAAGVWVASGREIPKGALLVKPPAEIATRFGALVPGEPHVVRDGAVIPLTAVGQRRSGST
jgi:carbonic anhydrase/acetyltransferase-like protein (isoleucine patch superfamily)